ncbi:MAG TPA: hypothetical protein PKD45_14145 [Flavobacteriales bacterium]|nr:hypothetical protein [Flavobacteriales bacterium]
MIAPPSNFVKQAFLPLLGLGLVGRIYLLLSFGFGRVSEDDAIIWSAAVDYAQGIFHEPYFYGQDYAVMLEALVAAPFIWLGIPLHILMPSVTTCLALAPFWSFAFWHRRHGRHLAALPFLAMPVLLPLEYGMLTTVTRCFVSGIALLAFLPWVLDAADVRKQAVLIGLITAAAAFVNPNSLVFSIAFIAWFLLQRPVQWPRAALLLLGAVPFAAAHIAAQAYCTAHPERMVHTVKWRMVFDPITLIPESFGMLDLHFGWLFPLLPAMGGLAFWALAAMAAWHLIRGNTPMGLGLLAAGLLIVASFGFDKTHDGFESPFFPYSRMYLAMPLLLCWGLTSQNSSMKVPLWVVPSLLLSCIASSLIMWTRAGTVLSASIPGFVPVNEIKIVQARTDAARMARLKEKYGIQLITGHSDWNDLINVRLRCYLYPLLAPSLAPTYMKGDRRYWQQDQYAHRVMENLLIVDVPQAVRSNWPDTEGRLIDVSDSLSGPLHVLIGNTLPTDSLLEHMNQMR